MSLTAKEVLRQIRREETYIRECQSKRDELRYAICASRKAIKFWRRELRQMKHDRGMTMNHRTVKEVCEAGGRVCRLQALPQYDGADAKFYCRVWPIRQRRCENFEGAFVDAFSIPAEN